MATVLVAFLASIFVVPTMASAVVWDEWIYVRSVESLVMDGQFRVPDFSGATLLFQTLWGSLFAKTLGMSFGALRLSTVVLVLISGLALYGLLRDLKIRPSLSALGTALFLFNPLSFVLSFTFMTDAPATALMVISTFFYVRAIRDTPTSGWLRALGGLFSLLAFLVRPQGILISVVAALHLLLIKRSKLTPVLQALGVPIVGVAAFVAWLVLVNGVPGQQTIFAQTLTKSAHKAPLLAWHVVASGITYSGLFLFPLAAAGIVLLFRRPFPSPWGWVLIGTCVLTSAWVLAWWLPRGESMPFGESWLTLSGPGPPETRIGRPAIFGNSFRIWLTIGSSLAAILITFHLGRPKRSTDRSGPRKIALIALLMLSQMIAVILPSSYFEGAHDRYFLPILPLLIPLALWKMSDIGTAELIAWPLVGVMTLFAVAGTRDFLTFERETWRLAEQTTADGVSYQQLSVGPGWDCYHLAGTAQTRPSPGQQWWIILCESSTKSEYVISGDQTEGHEVIKKVAYSNWLSRRPTFLYLLKRTNG